MSYQRLVMCLDDSGSMSGNKINNSIKYLNKIAKDFGVTTTYFKFGNKVELISCYNRNTLPCGQGTCIEKCLNDLFTNRLRRFSGKTKFIFVTDAQDSIRNVQNVISNKKSCESAYGNKLHSYCLLVGGSGGCSNELRQIFGSNSFDHVNDSNFQSILKKICGNIKAANKLQNVQMNVESEINTLKQNTNPEMRAIGNKLGNIKTIIKESNQKTQQAQTQIAVTKQNLTTLNQQTTSVTNQVNTAYTDREIDDAEDAARALKSGYRKEQTRLTSAGKLLDESQTAITGETARAENIANKLKENSSKISQQANVIISNIINSLKQLSGITTGAYEQVQDLKKQFEKDLDQLMSVVNANNTLQSKFEGVQKDISNAFKQYKRGRVELSGFKMEIYNKMDTLNQLLEILDER
eukprot:322591_1